MKKFNPKARAEEIAAQLKAAEEAEKLYAETIDEAVKNAGRTRAEFVEMLYDHFDIEPETSARKDKNGEVIRSKDGAAVQVKTDKDESVRILKLAEKFEQLVAKAEASSAAESPAKPQPQNGAEQVKHQGAPAGQVPQKAA